MRLISFSMTWDAFLAGQKCVTRRLPRKDGRDYRVGEVLLSVNRLRSKDMVTGGPIYIEHVVKEQLLEILTYPDWETEWEGLPDLTKGQFIDRFCESMGCEFDQEIVRYRFASYDTRDLDPKDFKQLLRWIDSGRFEGPEMQRAFGLWRGASA